MTANTHHSKGFTLIEILITISVFAIIAGAVLLAINPAKLIRESRLNITKANLNQIIKAAQTYMAETGRLPPDANRNIPAEFMPQLGAGPWPNGPFPGSIYDWDNWENNTCWDGSTGIIQITLREVDHYNSQENYNLYMTMRGEGIPHCDNSAERGECLNCVSRYP